MTQLSNAIAEPGEGMEQWIASLAKRLGTAIKWRRRGNSLHILCEAPVCPKQDRVTAQTRALLSRQNVNNIVTPGQPPIYQIWCYGREVGQYQPAWSAAIALDSATEPYAGMIAPESSHREFSRPAAGTPDRSTRAQRPAKQSPTTAVAQRLSKILSPLGIAVTARIKPYGSSGGSSGMRLWVACQASYSPAPNLIAEPIAAAIRQVSLPEVRDAVVLVKVRGEDRVDWVLKIDLTPAYDILEGWAHWGDVEAVGRLLNIQLKSEGLGGMVTDGKMMGATLQLRYSAAPEPMTRQTDAERSSHFEQVLTTLSGYLQTLSPQGIHALQLAEAGTSFMQQRPIADPLKQAAEPPESPWSLARRGQLAAIQFLLSRMLNPDLDQRLATGGIRVQVLMKDHLMHVMCDGPLCPEEASVAGSVQDLVEQIATPSVHGVRVYGRRAGQRRPRWRTGTNFDKQRFVPEPSPTFAATDAYVAELMSPDAETAEPSLSGATPGRQPLRTAWEGASKAVNQRLRQALLRSQLFVPGVNARDLVQPNRNTSLDMQLAVVWGAVGLLLLTQADLATGWWVDSRVSAAAPPSQAVATQIVADQDSGLASGPLTEDAAAALLDQSPFPLFNNSHLDLKLALYYQRLQTVGPPDVVLIGSSRAMRGLDPAVLKAELTALGYPDATVFNFGVNGATAQVVDLILRRILQPHQLPKLVIWADGARAFNQGRTDETYQAMVPSDGYSALENGTLAVDSSADAETNARSPSPDDAQESGRSPRLFERYQALDKWLSDRLGGFSTAHPHRDRIKAWVTQRFQVASPQLRGQGQTSPSDPSIQPGDVTTTAGDASDTSTALSVTGASPPAQINAAGFLPISIRFDPATYYQQYAQVPGNYDKDYLNFDMRGAQTESLRQVIELAETEDMTLVFINTPLTQEYLDPFRAGHEQTFRQYMIDIALQHEEFVFRDLSRLWLDRPDYHQYFSDPSHLNRYGAVELSNHLAHDPLVPWPSATK